LMALFTLDVSFTFLLIPIMLCIEFLLDAVK